MPGDPVLWLSDPTTTRHPLPPTAEKIVQAQVGVRNLSQVSALLLGLPPQPKADRQPPEMAASTSGTTQYLNWWRRGLDSLNLLSNMLCPTSLRWGDTCRACPETTQCTPDHYLPGIIPSAQIEWRGWGASASKSGWGRRSWTGPNKPGVGDQVDENPSRENNYSINHLPNSSGSTIISFLSILKYNVISSHSI